MHSRFLQLKSVFECTQHSWKVILKQKKKTIKSFKSCCISHRFRRICHSFTFRLLDFDSADHSILSLIWWSTLTLNTLLWSGSGVSPENLRGFVSSSALLINSVTPGVSLYSWANFIDMFFFRLHPHTVWHFVSLSCRYHSDMPSVKSLFTETV